MRIKSHKTTKAFLMMLAISVFGLTPTSFADDFYQGYVEGDYLWIGLEGGGVVKSQDVARGDSVRAGQALFSIDDTREAAILRGATSQLERAKAMLSDLEKGMRDSEISAILARLEQAKSSLDLAELTLQRQLGLQRTGVASQQNLDAAKAGADLASSRVVELEADLITARLGARDDVLLSQLAEVERLRALVDEASWTQSQRHAVAPVAGYIEDVFYRVGEFMPKGSAGVSLLAPENIKVRFFVGEEDFANIQIGQVATIYCDGCREAGLRAKVSYISSRAEFTPPVIYSEAVRDKLVFMVEARFDSAMLKPGQPVDVVVKR